VSFLDDLKRQADAQRERLNQADALLDERAALTEDACALAARYLTQLAQQLEVLRPPSPATYQLDRRTSFSGLPMSDFFADARLQPVRNGSGHEHLVLHWQVKSGQTLSLVKNFPNEIEQLEARLRQAAVPVEAEALRDPDNGKLIEMRYQVQADFRAGVKITPDHERAMLAFRLTNVERLESITFDLAADALTEARLDDLARWITGAPQRFLQGVTGLRVIGG
jgi:hypothetical protein